MFDAQPFACGLFATTGDSGNTPAPVIWNKFQSSLYYSLSNSGLTATGGDNSDHLVKANTTWQSGSYTVTPNFAAGGNINVGFDDLADPVDTWVGTGVNSTAYGSNGSIYSGGTTVGSSFATYTTADVIKAEIVGGKAYFYKNGVLQNVGGTTLPAGLTAPYPTASTNKSGNILVADFSGWSGSANQTLTPALFTNSQTFYSPTIVPGAITLTPSLFTNTQNFFAPTIIQIMLPSLVTNAQTFFSPTIVPGAVTLTPALVTNSQTFYSPTVSPGAVTLTPSLFTNTQTFFSPTVAITQTLTPSLFTNLQTFFTPTVVPGTTTLAPSLFTNSQTFFSPTMTEGGVTVAPSLFTNTQTFYSPTIVPGVVTLLPSLFTNSNTFFAPIVTEDQRLTPSLFTNSQNFFAPTIDSIMLPPLVTNSQTFYSPTVSGTLNQTLLPNLFTDGDTFYSPIILPGAVTIAPSLVTNNQAFYSPLVGYVIFLGGAPSGFMRDFSSSFMH